MSMSRAKRAVPRLRRSSNGMLMTPEEFDAAEVDDDDPYHYELVRGVLIVTPPPGASERDPNGELEYFLRAYKAEHPQGSALDKTLSEQTIYLPDSRRIADRAIWAGLGRVPNPETDVPTILVEFVSKRKRDRVRDYEEKRREYLALGVSEYWIFNRFRRVLTVYRKPPTEPAELAIEAEGTYRTPLLPGFELPLARIWRVADDWKRPR
jgi:Uma2 family endonuclease